MKRFQVFSSAKAMAIVMGLSAFQSVSVVGQMRPRQARPGYGEPGQRRDVRTERFLRKGLQEKRDEETVKRAGLAAAGEHVDIYGDGLTVAPRFLVIAEEAYGQLQELTGRKFDTAVLGPKIRIIVSDAVTISHVWKGYDHPKDPRGIIFLNPRVYRRAVEGTDATYVHEMAHLLTWRFHSHTLREGIANYLAQRVRPGAGSGANPGGYDWSVKVPEEITKYLGTTKEAPRRITSEPESRGVYYYACYRFVKYLVDTAGLEVFMKLYESPKPEAEFPKLYGVTRKELIARAGM